MFIDSLALICLLLVTAYPVDKTNCYIKVDGKDKGANWEHLSYKDTDDVIKIDMIDANDVVYNYKTGQIELIVSVK